MGDEVEWPPNWVVHFPVAYSPDHRMPSACGKWAGFHGNYNPLIVTCANCKRTTVYREALITVELAFNGNGMDYFDSVVDEWRKANEAG